MTRVSLFYFISLGAWQDIVSLNEPFRPPCLSQNHCVLPFHGNPIGFLLCVAGASLQMKAGSLSRSPPTGGKRTGVSPHRVRRTKDTLFTMFLYLSLQSNYGITPNMRTVSLVL